MPSSEVNSIRPFDATTVPLPSAPGPAADFWDSVVPTDLEIGPGVGWHPITYAKNNPQRRLIAIEHSQARFESFSRRHSTHGLGNLFPVHANAVHWITHHVPAGKIERIFILFPNPYPKQGQRNKRWHAMPFREQLVQALAPGGRLLLATNTQSYAEEAAEMLNHTAGLSLVDKLTYSREHERGQKPRTHFEKKYLQRGETCYELVFSKRQELEQ
jgi:tRNA (guanine-N7-)-methyltransferase